MQLGMDHDNVTASTRIVRNEERMRFIKEYAYICL